MTTEEKDIYAIGEIPPLGHVPKKMHAWVKKKIDTAIHFNLLLKKNLMFQKLDQVMF